MAGWLPQLPEWLPWASIAVLVVIGAVRETRARTHRRKVQQEMSRLRAFAAIHGTRADDLGTKVDHQRYEVALLTARLESAQTTIAELRAELGERPPAGDAGDGEALRARLAELEEERDRLAVAGRDGDEAEELRARLADAEDRHARELAAELDRSHALERALRDRVDPGRGDQGRADTAELIRLRTRVVELERAKADLEARRDQLMHRLSGVADFDAERLRERLTRLEEENADLRRGASAGVIDLRPGAALPSPEAGRLEEAADVLGIRVVLDDLKVIDGIGPKIERLCQAAGIGGWQALAETEPEELRSMLAAAGPAYRSHDPVWWIRQAELLAAGRWEELRLLVAEEKTSRRR